MTSTISLISRIITPILLIISICLTILPLLPSPIIPLFVIRPAGSPLPRPYSTSPTNTSIPELGSIPPIYDIARLAPTDTPQVEAPKAYLITGAGAPLAKPNLPPSLWMGDDGPSIDVGALRVCSKVTQGTREVCERLSEYVPGLENAVMPPSLSSVMSSYPTSSPGPILLVISASFQILAILCFLLNLVPWSRIAHCVRYRQSTKSQRAYPTTDTESGFGLVQDSPFVDERGTRKSWGFLFFWILAFGLGLGGVGVVLSNVSEAAGRWDVGLAKEVGMEFQFGAGCYLMGSIPLVLLLAGIAGVIPFIQDIVEKYRTSRTSYFSNSRKTPSAASGESMGLFKIDVEPVKRGSCDNRAEKDAATGTEEGMWGEQPKLSSARKDDDMRMKLESEGEGIGQAR